MHVSPPSFSFLPVIKRVELQGRSSAQIMIKANIVEQMLELLGLPHSDRIGCIHFGCVYFGTSKIEQVILHNKSPESMDWVAILQDNVAGVEMVRKGNVALVPLSNACHFFNVGFSFYMCAATGSKSEKSITLCPMLLLSICIKVCS